MLSFPDLSALLKGVNSDHLEDMGDRLNFYITVGFKMSVLSRNNDVSDLLIALLYYRYGI